MDGRYYDTRCADCDGCAFLGTGAFPDGQPYEVCRYYGYILHPDKGISAETCQQRRTRLQIEDLRRMLQTRERRKREQVTLYEYLDR